MKNVVEIQELQPKEFAGKIGIVLKPPVYAVGDVVKLTDTFQKRFGIVKGVIQIPHIVPGGYSYTVSYWKDYEAKPADVIVTSKDLECQNFNVFTDQE